MNTFNQRGIIHALSIAAFLIALPGLLIAQEPTLAQTTDGPLAIVDAPSNAELPPAPSAAIVHQSLPLGHAAMFPIIEVPAQRRETAVHPFWDRQNVTLFAVTAGWAAADFYVTKSNLDAGGREMNPVARIFTRNTPMLATNFALETGGVIGMSYFFHRTGHHKLERMTSYVDISASAGAVLYGLTHR